MDFPYIILFFLLFWLTYKDWKSPSQLNFKIAVWAVFIFMAFRAPVVGADTWNYYKYLTGVRNFYNADQRELELGFLVYREICLKIFLQSGILIMIANTFFTLVFVYYMIKKCSYAKVLSIFVMFLLFNYANWFIALRQTLGFSIYLGGLLYFMDDKKYKWFVHIGCAILGYLFHTSIIIYFIIGLLCLFINIQKREIYIFAIIISLLIGIVLQDFDVFAAFNYFSSLEMSATERLNGYLESEAIKEESGLNILLRPSIIALITMSLMDKDKLNHVFTKFYIFGVLFFNLFWQIPMTHRLVFIFETFGCVVVTWIFGTRFKNDIKIRKIATILSILVFLYFGRSFLISQYQYDLSDARRLHPYYFFWENYHSHPSITRF